MATHTTYSTDIFSKAFGYYRCSQCRKVNTFELSLRKSMVTTDYKPGDKSIVRKMEQLREKKKKMIENAPKGNFWQPCRFSGACAACGRPDPWLKTAINILEICKLTLPIIVLIVCFILKFMTGGVIAAAGTWLVLFLLSMWIGKHNSDAEARLDREYWPKFFENPDQMKSSLEQDLAEGETPVELKKIVAG